MFAVLSSKEREPEVAVHAVKPMEHWWTKER